MVSVELNYASETYEKFRKESWQRKSEKFLKGKLEGKVEADVLPQKESLSVNLSTMRDSRLVIESRRERKGFDRDE